MAPLAHAGIPGAGPFVATGLFLVAAAAAGGVFWLRQRHRTGHLRAARFALTGVAAVCLVAATTMPLLLHATAEIGRPSTRARLTIVSPREGEVVRGNPAVVDVRLRLVGGRIVPLTSLHFVPNAGHIHLYLDGGLVSMTPTLRATIAAPPGSHVLRAEFVAVDHGPFDPRVLATVSFRVET
jgi:hypothetical protein